MSKLTENKNKIRKLVFHFGMEQKMDFVSNVMKNKNIRSKMILNYAKNIVRYDLTFENGLFLKENLKIVSKIKLKQIHVSFSILSLKKSQRFNCFWSSNLQLYFKIKEKLNNQFNPKTSLIILLKTIYAPKIPKTINVSPKINYNTKIVAFNSI